jgi:hypothetical protein
MKRRRDSTLSKAGWNMFDRLENVVGDFVPALLEREN